VQLAIHPDAQLEIIEAADWYEQRATGLGDDLVAEVQAALDPFHVAVGQQIVDIPVLLEDF
jgi:hypothetical protein